MPGEREDHPASSPISLDLDSIFVSKEFRVESLADQISWASGSCYTALVKSGSNGRTDLAVSDATANPGGVASNPTVGDTEKTSSARARDLVWHDVATNTTKTYVSSDLLIPPGHDTPLSIDDYALSPDKSRLLIFTNSRKVWPRCST